MNECIGCGVHEGYLEENRFTIEDRKVGACRQCDIFKVEYQKIKDGIKRSKGFIKWLRTWGSV